MLDLNELTATCYNLEPLPPTSTQLLRVALQEEVDVEEIVRIVSYDPVLTARLLRVANSVEVGGARRIGTVRDAILRLGVGLVLGIALGSSVRVHLDGAAHPSYVVEGDLWRHSVAAAIAGHFARIVSKRSLPVESFTAALLHDIGKLVLLRHMTPEVSHVLQHAEKYAGLSQLDAESGILGIHHGELGGLIARHWRLPEPIVSGITYHHDPERLDLADNSICWVVHLSDLTAKIVGAGLGDDSVPTLDDHVAVIGRLGLDEDSFKQLCERVAENLEAVMRWYA